MVSIVSHTGMGLAKVTWSDRWEWGGGLHDVMPEDQ